MLLELLLCDEADEAVETDWLLAELLELELELDSLLGLLCELWEVVEALLRLLGLLGELLDCEEGDELLSLLGLDWLLCELAENPSEDCDDWDCASDDGLETD